MRRKKPMAGVFFFHSHDCAPCAEMLPAMRKFRSSLRGHAPVFVVRILNVDSREGGKLFEMYKLEAVPSYVVAGGGAHVTGIGLRDYGELCLWFAKSCVKLIKCTRGSHEDRQAVGDARRAPATSRLGRRQGR